jgi:uncharacterized protein (TIGR02145 family)
MRRRNLLSASSGETGRKMIGDYEVVDLGLPSGLLFATWNVGANSETDYGTYHKYGYGSQEVEFSEGYYQGMEDPLASTADTATQVMGSEWRMPTNDEFQELIDNTNYEWVENFKGSGINGGKFTSKTNPNAYVFFPAAGYYQSYNHSFYEVNSMGFYWSSTPYDSNNAYYLSFISFTADMDYRNDTRPDGYSVRGVHAAVWEFT